MPKYARDEFDKVPEAASRQGVHRAATPPSRVRLWPILAAGAVALAIGAVAFLILPKLGFSPAGQASSSVGVPVAGSTASAEPTKTQAPTATASATPTATAEPVPSETVAPVDKTQPVAVFNATGTAGLAGRVGGTVQADGWSLGEVANWSGAPQQASVIFYAGEAQLANAQALAALLGIPKVISSTEFQAPLIVVLGPGFA